MKVGLFIPCYINAIYPNVGVASYKLLKSLGVDVDYPLDQTCCGQPMANTGCDADTAPVAKQWVKRFAGYDAVVCPSGSCASMIRNHYADYFRPDDTEFQHLRENTFELCEFVVDRLGVRSISGTFKRPVSIHSSCHGLRELRLGACSENMTPREDKMRMLLESLDGIEIKPITRVDECCGFGGTFAVAERETSVAMGIDRVTDHISSGSEVMIAGDMSCLMHMGGLIRRRNMPMSVKHIAEVLVEAMQSGSSGSDRSSPAIASR